MKRFSLLLLFAGLLFTGCDSSSDAADDDTLNGLWQGRIDANVYLYADPGRVFTYEFFPQGSIGNTQDCYSISEYEVLSIDGDVYELRDITYLDELEVTLRVDGDELTTILMIEGSPNTVIYERSLEPIGDLRPSCLGV